MEDWLYCQISRGSSLNIVKTKSIVTKFNEEHCFTWSPDISNLALYLQVKGLNSGVSHWLQRVKPYTVSLNHTNGFRCYLKQDSLLSWLSAGWSEEQIIALFR